MKKIYLIQLFLLAIVIQSCNKQMPTINLTTNKTTVQIGETIFCDASKSTNTTSFYWRVDNTEKLDSNRSKFNWKFIESGKHIIAVTCINKNISGTTKQITVNVLP